MSAASALAAVLLLALAGTLLSPRAGSLARWRIAPAATSWREAPPDFTPVRRAETERLRTLDSLPLANRGGMQISHVFRRGDRDPPMSAILLPAVTGKAATYVNGLPTGAAAVGPAYPGGGGARPSLARFPERYLRPGLNRIDVIVTRAEGVRAIAAPPHLGPASALGGAADRMGRTAAALRAALLPLAWAAAALAVAGAVASRRTQPLLGLAAAAAAIGARTLLEPGALPPFLLGYGPLLDRVLLLLALLSVACAVWRSRPRGLSEGGRAALWAVAATGIMTALAAAWMSLGLLAGLWPWRLSAVYGAGLIALLAALAGWSGMLTLGVLIRLARTHLDLSRIVRRQKAEIEAASAALEQQMRRSTILEERQRLARDMHDGIGGQLVSLIARVRSRRIDIDQVETELRGGLTELRLVVDSLDATGQSLAEALAAFRSRAQPQAEDAGMTLTWEQPEMLEIETSDPRWMLNLYRLLQEAMTNAVRHSGADRLSVRVALTGERTLSVQVTDNGSGIARDRETGGKGLPNMAFRARQLGGELQIGAGEDGRGTRIALEIEVPAADQSSGEISPS